MTWRGLLIAAILCSSRAVGQSSARGSISGIVQDPLGLRIAKASIVAERLDVSTVTAQTTASESGEFALELPPGRYRLSFSQKGFLNMNLYPAVVSPTHRLRLRVELPFGEVNGEALTEDVTVSGLVVTGTNYAAAAGVTVCLRRQQFDSTCTIADMDGFYLLNLPSGLPREYKLAVLSKAGQRLWESSFEADPSARLVRNIFLDR